MYWRPVLIFLFCHINIFNNYHPFLADWMTFQVTCHISHNISWHWIIWRQPQSVALWHIIYVVSHVQSPLWQNIHGWFHPGQRMTHKKRHNFFLWGYQYFSKINIDTKQPTCMYQLRFSRGPHHLFFRTFTSLTSESPKKKFLRTQIVPFFTRSFSPLGQFFYGEIYISQNMNLDGIQQTFNVWAEVRSVSNFFWNHQFELIFHKFYPKTNRFSSLMTKPLSNFFWSTLFNLCRFLELIYHQNRVFHTYISSNAAETLQFEDLAV